jgi:nickel/cobalt exporter
MNSFSTLLQQGSSWLFVPSAMLLGALHGLEPGHSKTMMAAFIIAVRGTLGQAMLLGLAATFSHTLVVWVIGLAGLYFGQRWNTEATEPYLQLVSAVLILAVAAWMLWRTWRASAAAQQVQDAPHHHDGTRRIDTGHGVFLLALTADGSGRTSPARRGRPAVLGRARAGGNRARGWQPRSVHLPPRVGHLVSAQAVAAPHEFVARLRLGDDHHAHDYDLEFVQANTGTRSRTTTGSMSAHRLPGSARTRARQ